VAVPSTDGVFKVVSLGSAALEAGVQTLRHSFSGELARAQLAELVVSAP
jgi:hypothetical protein